MIAPFLRRIYLDVIGFCPVRRSFNGSKMILIHKKNDSLPQQLFDQKRDYTQHWMTFWNEILRNDYTGTDIFSQRVVLRLRIGFITSIRDNIAYDLFCKRTPQAQLKKPPPPPRPPPQKALLKESLEEELFNASQRVESKRLKCRSR